MTILYYSLWQIVSDYEGNMISGRLVRNVTLYLCTIIDIRIKRGKSSAVRKSIANCSGYNNNNNNKTGSNYF